MRRAEKKLSRLQRRLSLKKKGSKNRNIAKATWIEAALAEGIPVPPPKYKPVLYQTVS